MRKTPTYSPQEIKTMCTDMVIERDAVAILADLIEEEINLYDEDDLAVLMDASMILLIRCMLTGSIKYL